MFMMVFMTDRDLLRHAVATIAYRGGKTLRGAPESFATFPDCGRTPIQILAHLGDLFDWSLSMADGSRKWNDSTPLPWPEETERFFRTLAAFDAYLASDQPLQAPIEKLFQGPMADALTHIGQIAMMRRLSGSPTIGENYYVADIQTGRVGAEQSKPVKPFA
jgi:hypothetical protein